MKGVEMYKTEIIRDKELEKSLNDLAAEGWRVISISARLLSGSSAGINLVVLERAA